MIPDNEYRKQRIERLLKELQYEVTRGIMENEIEEEMGFTFVVPRSRTFTYGVVWCEFRTRPLQDWRMMPPADQSPRLKLVKK